MNVLHSMALSVPSAGIVRQMACEQNASLALSLKWDVRIYCPGRGMLELHDEYLNKSASIVDQRAFWQKMAGWLRMRRDYYKMLLRLQSDYDAFVLRYSTHDPFQWRFMQKAQIPVYFVHHTLEVPELRSSDGFRVALRAYGESVLGRRTIAKARGIIGVTREIADYELSRVKPRSISATVYPNGILYKDKAIEDRRSEIPELLFIASEFYAWHGLGLLLSAIDKSTEDFVLHLVGTLGKQDLMRAQRDARVKLHGLLSSDEIGQLAMRCHVGLSSFALDRKGMKEACTLKVREYMQMGLPVYAGHADVFPSTFAYYKNGPIDMQHILSFARKNAIASRAEVSTTARPYIDKISLLSNLANFIRDDLGM